jgi:ketosteroid isomerase-like protein
MQGIRMLSVFGIFMGLSSALPGRDLTALGETRVAPGSIVETDRATVAELLATFDRAEQAVQARDLNAVMAFYSDDYHYHGLKKTEMRKIWDELFADYRQISSTHLFSTIRTGRSKSGLTAEVTCTGALWATSDLTGLRVPIDSWHEEVHFLVKEDGSWRIRGNAGEAPKTLPFGTAPHPLF